MFAHKRAPPGPISCSNKIKGDGWSRKHRQSWGRLVLSDGLCPTPGSPGSRGSARMPKQRSQIFEAANVCAMQEVARGPRAGAKNEWTCFPPKDLQSSPIHITWLHPSSQMSKQTRAQRGLGIAPDHTQLLGWSTSRATGLACLRGKGQDGFALTNVYPADRGLSGHSPVSRPRAACTCSHCPAPQEAWLNN